MSHEQRGIYYIELKQYLLVCYVLKVTGLAKEYTGTQKNTPVSGAIGLS